MALHYGYSPLQVFTYPTTFVLSWRGLYGAPSKNGWLPPINCSGFPHHTWMFGGWLNEKSELRVISQIFDNTQTITTLTLTYSLQIIYKTGTQKTVDLNDIQIVTKKIPNTNISILNERFIISEKVTDWENIMLFHVKFIQLSNESYGNKSDLTVFAIHMPK